MINKVGQIMLYVNNQDEAVSFWTELGVSEENTTAIEFYRSIGMITKGRKMEITLNYRCFS